MNLNDLLHGLGGPWAYPAVALFAFLESAAFVGLVIPGETAMLLGGVLAATGQVNLLGMVLAGSVGAVLGDSVSYHLGRVAGPGLRSGRAGRWVGVERWCRAEALVARRGGPAVFVGRWIGVLRAVVPAAAGAVGMPRAQFLAWNAIGGTLWATTVICVGFGAGASWQSAQAWLGTGALVAAGAAAVLIAAILAVRQIRAGATLVPSPRVVGALGAGLLGVAVGELSDNVIDRAGITAIDGPVLGWTLSHRTPDVTTIMVVLTNLGSTVTMTVLAAVVITALAWRRRWPDAVLVAAVTLGAGALVVVLKPLIGRVRPPAVDHLVLETNQSFPSGHAVGAAAVLGVLAVIALRRTRRPLPRTLIPLAAAAAAAAIGLSRLYLGVHWASDVIVGWLIGALWLTVCLLASHTARPARHTREPDPNDTSRPERDRPDLDRRDPAAAEATAPSSAVPVAADGHRAGGSAGPVT